MAGSPTFYIAGIECSYPMPQGRIRASESSTEAGPRVTIPIKCAYQDRWALVQALLPTCSMNPDGLTWTRTPPYALPSNPNLVCVATEQFEYVGSAVDGSGDAGAIYAIVPAVFSPVPWQFVDGDPGGQNDASGQAWTVTKLKPSCEVYQPSGGTYWLGPFPSTTPLDEGSVGFLRPNLEISVCRKFLPKMPLSAISAAIGCTNSTNMTFGDKTFTGAGTGLLLVAAEASDPYFDCIGNPVMDVNFTFLGRLVASWNSAQDRTGSWQAINTKQDGTGSPPFANSYDFNSLPR